jgi:hypothetical protein
MKLMRLFCVVLTIIICPFAQAQEALVRIYVTLSNGRSQGSGFFTSNDGKIITAYHVIQGANTIEVRSEKLGTFTNIRVDSISPDYDLAVLQVLNSGVTPFVNLEDYAPSNQDDLQVQGYPVGAPYQLIRTSATQPGFVQTSDYNNIRRERLFAWNVQVIPLGAIVFSGMSGGPVIYRNRVIGILSGSYVQGGSIAWAIPAKYVSTQLLQPVQLNADQIERWEPVRLMDASAWKSLRSMVRMNPAAAAVSDEVSNGVEALAETYSELYKQAMHTQQDMDAYRPILERVAAASSLDNDGKTSNELMEQASGLFESIEKFENLSDQAGKQGQEMAQEMIKLGMWIADQSHVNEGAGKALAKRMTSITDEHKDMTLGIDAYVGVDSQTVVQVGRKFTVTTIKSRTLAGEARAFLQFLDAWSAIVNAYSSPRALLFMSADISMKRRIVQLLEPVVYQMN